MGKPEGERPWQVLMKYKCEKKNKISRDCYTQKYGSASSIYITSPATYQQYASTQINNLGCKT